MKLLLLPGMDGTGLLFERFAAALPPSIEPIVCRYPPSARRYDDLRSHVPLPSEPFAILAESFSGAGRGRFEALDAPHLVLQTRPREAAARVAAFLAACNDRL